MPIVIPAGFGQIVLQWRSPTFDTGGGATVLGFGTTPDPTPIPIDVFAETVAEEAVSELLPGMHEAITLEGVYWATATTSGLVPVGENGGRTGDLAPPSVTTLVSYGTSAKGPRGRGRSYFPGYLNDPDINDSGGISGARRDAVQQYIDSFFTNTGPEDTPQVILQRDEEDQKSPPLSPPPAVTVRVVSSKPATQRRRLRR